MPLFRQGLSHLLFIQLLYSGAFITDCLGRPSEGGGHPQVLECILSSTSFRTITMGSQAELPYKGSDNRQVLIFSFCSSQWGGASSCVFLSSGRSGGGGGFHKILSLNRQSQYAVKQSGLRPPAHETQMDCSQVLDNILVVEGDMFLHSLPQFYYAPY